jgi:hypothetical protein
MRFPAAVVIALALADACGAQELAIMPYSRHAFQTFGGTDTAAYILLEKAWTARSCQYTYASVTFIECVGIALNSHWLRERREGRDLAAELISRVAKDAPPEPFLYDGGKGASVNPEFANWSRTRSVDVMGSARSIASLGVLFFDAQESRRAHLLATGALAIQNVAVAESAITLLARRKNGTARPTMDALIVKYLTSHPKQAVRMLMEYAAFPEEEVQAWARSRIMDVAQRAEFDARVRLQQPR